MGLFSKNKRCPPFHSDWAFCQNCGAPMRHFEKKTNRYDRVTGARVSRTCYECVNFVLEPWHHDADIFGAHL